MGTFRFLLKYGNDDATTDLNNRLQGIVTPGLIGSGGEVVPTPGLAVNIGPVAAINYDGATVLYDGTSVAPITAPISLVDGSTDQYVLLHAKYNDDDDPDVEIVILKVVDFNALSADDKKYYLIIAKLEMSSSTPHVSVPPTLINYRYSDRIDAISRYSYRGTVANTGSLPTDAAEKYNRIGDFYLVLNTHILYYWDGSAWQEMSNIISMTSTWHGWTWTAPPPWTTAEQAANGIVSDLAQDVGVTGCGSYRVGSEAITGTTGPTGYSITPTSLTRDSIREQLTELLNSLNQRPRIDSNENITGDWDINGNFNVKNFITLLTNTGFILGGSSPGTGSSDKVMRLLSSYTDVTYGDCGIWQSIDGELWITQNCYWSGVNPITHLVENKWRATVTLPNKDAYAIRFKNITDSEGIGGVVFYSKSRNHAVTSGWDRTTIGGLNTWSSFIEVCNVHSVTNEDIYSCSTVSGHTYERLPIYFYYKNYTAFVIPGGNSFIVPLQYRSRYLSAPTVGSLHPHTKTVVGSIQLNTTAGVYPIEMDQWGCFVYIDVLNPLGIPSGAAVTLTGYVDVQT